MPLFLSNGRGITLKLSREEKQLLKPIFLGQADKHPCTDCGGLHERQCPRIKKKIWHQTNGNLLEVEYWSPGWEASYDIIWPEDVFDDDEDE
jgi:hypothetical protein